MHQDMQVASRKQYQLFPVVDQSHPWLLFCHGKDNQRQTFFSISKDQYYVRIIPEMRGKVPCCCSYGWLVMHDIQSDDWFLFNPISLQTIPLPPLLDFDYSICILSLPPTDPNCQILFLVTDFFMSCQPGDNEYIKREYQIEAYDQKTYLENENEEFEYYSEESYIEDENEELEFEDGEFEYDDEESYIENENEELESEDGEFQYGDEESYTENENEGFGFEDEEFQYDNEEINEELDFEFQHDDEEIYVENENEELGLEHEDIYLGNAIFFEGKIYGTTLLRCKLVVADFEGSSLRFRFRPLIKDERILPRRVKGYLMESHGEVLLVQKIYSDYATFMEEGIDFEIFRIDFSNMELVEVRNIGERSIFLEMSTGRCCDVEPGIRKNSIYFIEPEDRYLYMFDIEDRSISISLPCPIVSTCNSSLSWIEL